MSIERKPNKENRQAKKGTAKKSEKKAEIKIEKKEKTINTTKNNDNKNSIVRPDGKQAYTKKSDNDRKFAKKEKTDGDRKFIKKENSDGDRKFSKKENADGNRKFKTKESGNDVRNFKSKENSNGDRKNIKNEESTSRRKEGKKEGSSNACPIYRKCGSCKFQDISYEKQLAFKQKQVEDLLGKYCTVQKIKGMQDPYHYRNKVQAVFSRDRRGNIISGVYEEGTHNVIPIESCLIEDKKADEIIGTIRGMLKSFKIKTYDEDTGYGLLRYVLVRRGFESGEIMVVLVIGSPVFPSKNNFVKALLKAHPEITTILLNINSRSDSMILGDREQVLYGKGYIEDTLCGLVFRISSKSFYQINPTQTETLYKKAIALANLTGKETVIDAYCGIGTIGLIASKQAKEVYGVEVNKDAIRDAIANAKRNNITNTRFFCADASDFMVALAEDGKEIDVVIMDPPRAGSTEVFLDAVAKLAPKKVVYISCNPITLERDMQYLTKKGYKAKEAMPVDMFPWTGHVEAVVLLSK